MSDFSYYIPQTIKIKGNLFFFKCERMFVGNSIEARKKIKKLRKAEPGKIFRLNYGTISEYV